MKINDFFSKENIEMQKEMSMYLCGPTVYDSPHIGNMRPIIIFDIINRVSSLKGKVFFIHNITDVDDKIIEKSIKENKTEKEISEKYELEYKKLLFDLNIITPNEMPKVTDHIIGMVDFISDLLNKNFAYEANGSVYFDVESFDGYSSKVDINGIKVIERNFDKKNQKDFVIWKKTNKGIQWDSPWGLGRPGWHTECAYFIYYFFKNKGIDLHGGGIDLKFPHHINEMAQYEAMTKKEMSRAWLYIGHLTVNNEKMSKSENNFLNASDFIQKYSSNVLRVSMILTSPQKPINFNNDVIKNAENFISKIKNALKKTLISMSIDTNLELLEVEPSQEFVDHLENNLDFGSATKFLSEQVKKLNSEIEIERKAQIVQKIVANLFLVGIKFDISYNNKREQMKFSKEKKDFVTFDILREGIIE